MKRCFFFLIALLFTNTLSAQDTVKTAPILGGWKAIADSALISRLVSKEDSLMPLGVPTYEVDNCFPRLSASPSGERRVFVNECLSQKFYRASFVSADLRRPVRIILVVLFTDKTLDLSRGDIKCEAWSNEGFLEGRSDDVFVIATGDKCGDNEGFVWRAPFLVQHFNNAMKRFVELINKR